VVSTKAAAGVEAHRTESEHGRRGFTGAHPVDPTGPADPGPEHSGPSIAPTRLLSAAPVLQDLPAVVAEDFTRAAAICATEAALGRVTAEAIEGITRRGMAQADALREQGRAVRPAESAGVVDCKELQ